MAFDKTVAHGALVDILDALNGDRRLGTGFRLLDDAIATSCRCLPRPTGTIRLPDPDVPGILVLVRMRKLGTTSAAFAVVARADPFSGLALLTPSSAAGLGVPEELNPLISPRALIDGLEPCQPELTPNWSGPVSIWSGDAWVEGTACQSACSLSSRNDRLPSTALGAPVFTPAGRVVGLVRSIDEAGSGASLCSLADHLPGWLLRSSSGDGRDPDGAVGPVAR